MNKLASRMQTHFRSSGEKKWINKLVHFSYVLGTLRLSTPHKTAQFIFSYNEFIGDLRYRCSCDRINKPHVHSEQNFLKMYNPHNVQLCKYVQSDDEIRLKSLL